MYFNTIMAFERDLEGAFIYRLGSVPSWKHHLTALRRWSRAEVRHSSKAKTVQCTKAQDQYFMHVYWYPRILLIACVHVHGPSLLWLQLFKPEHTACAAEHHPPTPEGHTLHCSPLTSFQSHVWLICCLTCLNFLSYQSSASVLFVILKWTSVWQQ